MIDQDIAEDEVVDAGAVPQSPVVVHAQYLKDLSFENPNAPEILMGADKAPAVDINIAVDSQKLENDKKEDFYEVILSINASATRDDKTMFIAEIKYGAMVSVHGLPQERHHPILFIEVPRMIFPFARLILSNSTQSGAFMPLQLALVDFRAMYMKRFGNKAPNEGDEPQEDKSQAS